MIIFHEGLPGSGKSYEAMSSRIVPALAKGRQVIAYIEGLDFDKIAELAGIDLDRCRELLTVITRDQLQTLPGENAGRAAKVVDHLPELVRDNALIVLDEAQNFWGNRARLSPAMTKLITEHRHRGMDIVLMGQDLRDVHATWRRRTELKLCFLKLNGFGKLFAKKYSCTTFRHLGGDEFKRVGVQVTTYDARYFGSYASHVADDTNTESYGEARGQVLGHPLLKYGVPASLLAGVVGLWQAWGYFHPEEPTKPATVAAAAHQAPAGQAAAERPRLAPAAAVPAPPAVDERTPIERRLTDLAGKGRIRLAGLVTMGQRTSGIVEWVQGGSVVMERLSLDALRTLGVAVLISGDVVQLAVGDYRELATPWPLEDLARASNAAQVAVRGPQALGAASPLPEGLGSAAAPPSFVDMPGTLTRGDTLGSAVARAAGG